jgi:hypothetical protein
MGTSTVSGPFRSQNGFQELVNGVWTPVGGGGGGGPTVIVADVDVTTTIPFTGEIGEVVIVVNNRSVEPPGSGTYPLVASCPVAPNAPIVDGLYLGNSGMGIQIIYLGSNFPLAVSNPSQFCIQFVVAGIRDFGGGDIRLMLNVSGMITNGYIVSP